jgi:hypothetical protein
MANDKLTSLELIRTLTSFIRVSIEQIWYYLEIYPKESFSKYTFYELEVFSTRHPAVCAYLDELEQNLQRLFKQGSILRLFLEFYDDKDKKYSIGFSFTDSLLFEQLKNDTQFIDTADNNNLFNTFELINELKSLLFSIINELNVINIKPSKSIGNFQILLSTNDDAEISSDNNWILEKTKNLLSDNSTFDKVDLQPFREISLGYLNIKGYIVLY